jgi:ubiquinone biosynthesis protein COQ9
MALEAGRVNGYPYRMTADLPPTSPPEHTPDLPLAELRPRLVAAMLVHVAFDGWTPAARNAAADDAGIDRDIAALALPDTAAMLDALTGGADMMMTAAMHAFGVETMKVRDRIRLALRTRLEQASEHREATRRAAALFASPQHAGLAARTLWRTADAMWRAAGDAATDFNHYSKRIILGGVYSASLLYWLEDDSEGHEATWAFIDRRIDGIMQFEKTKAQLKKAVAWLPDPARFLGRLRYPVS